mgnify:CR=1 FL=1
MITAKVIADSMSPAGKRITTFVCEYPRFIHAEIMTHRMLSRCAASSRAIPVAKMLSRVYENPAAPEWWGANQKGMQAEEELTGDARGRAEREWWYARDNAVASASALVDQGLHKQLANRLIEPWLNIIIVCTATEWDNFYSLRLDKMAQPEFRVLAEKMLAHHNASEPRLLAPGEWHLPFISEEEKLDLDGRSSEELWLPWIKASVARCARVSTLNHDGSKPDLVADLALHDRLLAAHHVSPFEHQARPVAFEDVFDPDAYDPQLGRGSEVDLREQSLYRSGNFVGWVQYRKGLTGENVERFSGLLDKSYIARDAR